MKMPAVPVPAVAPFDEALVAEVHPDEWVNPAPRERYHLVVVGAGTAGLVTAAAAAGLGARVALVERHLMGGDCLNVGCVPSKAILSAGRAWAAARGAAAEFGGPPASGDGDFALAMQRMRRLRARLAPIDGAARFQGLGIDVFFGHGTFTSPTRLEVDGAGLQFRRAVIATGARAAVPAIPGLAAAGYHTNETIFDLTTRPGHLVVLGAGPIGCELAQAFVRLGVRVTLVDQARGVLPREDRDAALVVQESLQHDGVTIVDEATPLRVEPAGPLRRLICRRHGVEQAITADVLLVATGRVANIEGLGLDAAGVRATSAGIEVDDRLRTANSRIYAVGDVSSAFRFTHAADAQARLVVQNALFFGRARASRLVIPWATYTSPELARVGLTEAEAGAAGVAIDVVTVPMHDVDRAVLDGDERGLLKLVLARGTDRILGATLVTSGAGDLIAEVTLAMTAGIGLGRIGQTIHPYPTRSEVLRKAADRWRRRKLTPLVTRLLARYFAWLT